VSPEAQPALTEWITAVHTAHGVQLLQLLTVKAPVSISKLWMEGREDSRTLCACHRERAMVTIDWYLMQALLQSWMAHHHQRLPALQMPVLLSHPPLQRIWRLTIAWQISNTPSSSFTWRSASLKANWGPRFPCQATIRQAQASLNPHAYPQAQMNCRSAKQCMNCSIRAHSCDSMSFTG